MSAACSPTSSPAASRSPTRPSPPAPRHSAIYLRDLLVSCGALPATDRQLAGYEGWVHRRLASLASHPHERLLRQFSLWHQLPRMRAKAATAPLRPSARKYAEQRFIQAENFLSWTAALGRQPAALTQADIDTWHATAAIHQKQGARSFLTWAMTARHIPALQLPQVRFTKGEAITQHRRLALLRRYLTDDHAPPGSGPSPASCCSTPSHSAASSA